LESHRGYTLIFFFCIVIDISNPNHTQRDRRLY
ncbi:hypothetical protein D050_4886B, partial [Vibrio parahaemolyticus VPCR-2009]